MMCTMYSLSAAHIQLLCAQILLSPKKNPKQNQKKINNVDDQLRYVELLRLFFRKGFNIATSNKTVIGHINLMG